MRKLLTFLIFSLFVDETNYYEPIEFVTLNDGSEGLILHIYSGNKSNKSLYKFVDPFLPSDKTLDVTNIFNDHRNNFITKSNKKISIIQNNVCVTDGLNENSFQQILNKITHHKNIYTLPIFKTIRNMLSDIVKKRNDHSPDDHVSIWGFLKSQKQNTQRENKSIWKKTRNYASHRYTDIFSYQQLNNQDLALITKQGIFIYTIDEDKYILSLRYFWNNKDWNDNWNEYKQNRSKNNENDINKSKNVDNKNYKTLIREVLNNEFSDSLSSLPSPNFTTIFENCENDPDDLYEKFERLLKSMDDQIDLYRRLLSNMINNPVEFSKFGSEILKKAIEEKYNFIVQLVFNKIIQIIKDNENNENNENNPTNCMNFMMLLPFIVSLKLSKLCDHDYHSNLVIEYFLHTSIILDPTCLSVKNSENPSLYAYSKNIFIKKS